MCLYLKSKTGIIGYILLVANPRRRALAIRMRGTIILLDREWVQSSAGLEYVSH